eukprot:1621286-Amphidinium_carterae.1
MKYFSWGLGCRAACCITARVSVLSAVRLRTPARPRAGPRQGTVTPRRFLPSRLWASSSKP